MRKTVWGSRCGRTVATDLLLQAWHGWGGSSGAQAVRYKVISGSRAGVCCAVLGMSRVAHVGQL
jgi:hypothetical protein